MLRWALTAGFLGGAASLAAVVGDAPLSSKPQPADVPDWIVAHNARQSLWNDSSLSDLNLGVVVRNGEALIWGPVPNEQLAAEAVARLKLLNGVRSVVSELYVLPADDLLRMRLTPPPRRISRPAIVTSQQSQESSVARLEQPLPVRPIPSRLIDIVEELRVSDRKYRFLRIHVENGVITVEGSVDQPNHAEEFGEACRRLPGVANVVLRLIP